MMVPEITCHGMDACGPVVSGIQLQLKSKSCAIGCNAMLLKHSGIMSCDCNTVMCRLQSIANGYKKNSMVIWTVTNLGAVKREDL